MISDPIKLVLPYQDCTVSTARINERGYAVVWFEGKHVRHHRLVFVQSNRMKLQQIEGKVVRHKCDNPACINPNHLELGTQAENVQDMVQRGRKVTIRGSDHKFAKLNESDIPIIRSMIAKGESQARVARIYKVDKALIRRIHNRQSWAHIK
jgi:hypothetical protein